MKIQLNGKPGMKSGAVFAGHVHMACYRDEKLKWFQSGKNLVVNEGLYHILDVTLTGATQVSTWYVGLKNTGSVAPADTLANHSGWTEFTDYSGDRPEYQEARSGTTVSNSSNKASFSITASGTVYGAFLCSVATGTTGTLLCAKDFSTSKSVSNGDTLNVQYDFSASSS